MMIMIMIIMKVVTVTVKEGEMFHFLVLICSMDVDNASDACVCSLVGLARAGSLIPCKRYCKLAVKWRVESDGPVLEQSGYCGSVYGHSHSRGGA
jgi:hypothetical protein